MPLGNINFSAEAAKHIASIFYEKNEPIYFVDVGARSGPEYFTEPLQKALSVIGFEVDEVECTRLNEFGGTKLRYYPYGLHEKTGEKMFYIARSPSCSGFNKINLDFSQRFQETKANEIVKEVKSKTLSLDDFLDRHKVPRLDFIKLDTEGAELPILKGSQKALKDKKVVGVLTEAWWSGFKDCDSFSDLDKFLREEGFSFFDLKLNYSVRKTLPLGKVDGVIDPVSKRLAVWRSADRMGQALTGDALYFRDPIADYQKDSKNFTWDDHSILSLVAFFDLFNYQDAAIEVLEFYRNKFTWKINVDHLIDLLTPNIGEHKLSYADYKKISETILALESKNSSNEQELKIKLPSELQNYSLTFIDSEQAKSAQIEEIGRLRSKIDELKGRLNNLMNSKSWKATAPIRWVGRKIRHLKVGITNPLSTSL